MIHTLSISDLTVSRGERLLFQGLDLRIQAGEAVVLTGANGAGKTSLLRAIAGLLRPDAGEVAFHDGDGNPLDERLARGRETHFLGHQDGLKTSRTARQELGFQCDWLGHVQCGLDDAVEAFGLAPLLDLEVRRLSAGQRRRLAMGRLVGSPRALWLLDEPMAPLDARWRAVFADQMRRHLDADGLILAAVHDPLPLPARTLDLGGLT
ncbi:cytochrome c biogenesis ATP-binding export protein CcmA [Brevundimonas intermedia]|uniref:Cytochrome c biogenesis ATP-binding export protein CcmA n=1 Tax=Brevundimonas intermedia TaxID=74315 RepID=A0ABQ5T8R7_9CAUL|nr:heme ABC exporter ATP-binding protein CcmA [Brevundimonas intermedia]GLK49195.1 cytochrome c biogenesis ATP-binding export protein CcmA [Brevundimonas intermedia]